jgi:hypothetical protein
MRYVLVAVYAAAPLAAFGADNANLVALADLAPYYLAIALPALAVTAFAAWRRGGAAADTTAVVLAVAILVLFDYWDVRPRLSALTHDYRPSMVFLWAVVLGIALLIAVRVSRRVARLPLVLLAAGFLMLVPSLVSWARESSVDTAPLARVRGETGQRLTVHPAPNVYFFMLDAYSRADRMRQQFGFDNSEFLNMLRSEGFVIPARSETGYGVTTLSVPTMLEMRYVISKGILDTEAVPRVMAGHNAVADTFRALGYSIAWAPSELPNWDCDGSEDECIRPTQTYQTHLGVSQLMWASMERTPSADTMRSVAPVHVNPLTARRQFPLRVAKTVLARRLRRPVFTFAHVLLTHFPYLYLDPQCKLAPVRGKLGAKAYLQAVACVNANVEAAIRLILARDPHAVIVLASDHGNDVGVDISKVMWEWDSREIAQRFSNFVALRLPPSCRRAVPERLAAVNIFRLVFNCLTDPDLRLQEPRRYLSAPTFEVRPGEDLSY